MTCSQSCRPRDREDGRAVDLQKQKRRQNREDGALGGMKTHEHGLSWRVLLPLQVRAPKRITKYRYIIHAS